MTKQPLKTIWPLCFGTLVLQSLMQQLAQRHWYPYAILLYISTLLSLYAMSTTCSTKMAKELPQQQHLQLGLSLSLHYYLKPTTTLLLSFLSHSVLFYYITCFFSLPMDRTTDKQQHQQQQLSLAKGTRQRYYEWFVSFFLRVLFML